MGLKVEHLHKCYGNTVVVEDLSFSIDKPGVYALLGTNGAGKTTSIRMMLGMLARDGGTVEWNGAPLDITTCNVGYLAEERGLYPKYGLMDQLFYFASLKGVPRKVAEERIHYWAYRLEVQEYLYPDEFKRKLQPEKPKMAFESNKPKKEKPRMADQLSKGNQQKIQFMTALLSDPELIILDEPLSGLDPVNMDIIKEIIREEIEKGKYIIMSSHQMATVEEFCTDLTILSHSKVMLQGNLNEIKKSYGRVHLHIKVEQDIDEYIARAGIEEGTEKEFEYELNVTGETQANALLADLIKNNIQVVTFELREPTLHEIFVKAAGEYDEQTR